MGIEQAEVTGCVVVVVVVVRVRKSACVCVSPLCRKKGIIDFCTNLHNKRNVDTSINVNCFYPYFV